MLTRKAFLSIICQVVLNICGQIRTKNDTFNTQSVPKVPTIIECPKMYKYCYENPNATIIQSRTKLKP